jgi:hypothetical protein
MIAYRPVLEILPAVAEGLLLFVGHRSILAWDARGRRGSRKSSPTRD